eukprot:COSAG04_NODE_500_length_13366_cov_33.972488_5_plen_157_part_00
MSPCRRPSGPSRLPAFSLTRGGAGFIGVVRYAFLNVSAAPPDAHGQQQQQPAAIKPFTITQFRRGCQVVPTNYNGHFESSDPDIDRIWWVGAYTVRVTLCGVGLGGGDRNQAPGVFLGSELMDRGDRIAFLGDAHVSDNDDRSCWTLRCAVQRFQA